MGQIPSHPIEHSAPACTRSCDYPHKQYRKRASAGCPLTILPLQGPETLVRSTLVTAGQCLVTMREAGLDEGTCRALLTTYPQLLHAQPEEIRSMLRTFARFSSGINITC